MPVVVLERFPLPSLKVYTSVSIALLAIAIYYGSEIVTRFDEIDGEKLPNIDPSLNIHRSWIGDSYGFRILTVLTQEAWTIWTLVNAGCCCLILLGKLIQKVVFGDLRISEQQHVKDTFWNFVFYKFIFVFGVMNVQNMDEVVLWCAWFAVLCCLLLLTQLSKDRFEYLSFSPMMPWWNHAKVLIVLSSIQVTCLLLYAAAIIVWTTYSAVAISVFMLAEVTLLAMKSLYVIVRYTIHLWDLHHDGTWENRAMYVYYAELIFELLVLSVDFAHHLHMLLWGNVFLSMASLVICMQLRHFFYEFQRRYRRHKNYLRVIGLMEARFPPASSEELVQADENCAICWEKMDTARKLPCNHMFHMACLRSWLEQDTSCPTCRMSLSTDASNQQQHHHGGPGAMGNHHLGGPGVVFRQAAANQHTLTNHFFHFDGSRYVSWLPSVSVEVTHATNLLAGNRFLALDTSQLNSMAMQVQEVFPHIPRSIIVDDLRVTRSVEITLENIVEGHIVVPQAASGEATAPVEVPSTSASDRPSQSLVTANSNRQDSGDTGEMSSTSHERRLSDSEQAARDALLSSRFSKSPSERETMLRKRKDSLLNQARRRFLHKDSPREGEGREAADN